MSFRLTRQTSQTSNYSARSTSTSFLRQSEGMQFIEGGQMRISRSPSMHGGAGGAGTRISLQSSQLYSGMESFGTSGSLIPHVEMSLITNEKLTMQNLNDRLASYLEKVRSLEAANRKLELQIREFYENRISPVSKDYASYFNTISELRAQIIKRFTENQSIVLQIDNARLAAEDFKIKYETELNSRMMVEADVSSLRGVRDSLTLGISDLEMQVEGLKEELAFMKTNHKEEMQQLRIQQTGTVNVEVDSASSVDLTKVLYEMREKYEALVHKNKLEVEKWFQSKVDTLQTHIITQTTEVKTFHTKLSELKKTYQSLEITRQSALSEIQCLKQNLTEVKSRYSVELSQLQMTINTLQTELQQLISSIDHQKTEYNVLLDIKMRLEMEIAEYRRLLEGEYEETRTVVISKVVKEEEHKPHLEKRVKIITEELVDGVVVNTSVDTSTEEIQ